jgi:anti-sigma B factor antagonist
MPAFPVTHLGRQTLIELPRRVSAANTRALMDAAQAELAAGRREIVLDLRKTDAIDSTALGAFVQLLRAAQAQTASLSLLGPNQGVRTVLAITRLDGVIPLAADLRVAGHAP